MHPRNGPRIASAIRDEADHVGVHVRVVEKLLTAHGGTAVHPRNGPRIASAIRDEADHVGAHFKIQIVGTPPESPVQSVMRQTTLVLTSEFR